MVIIYFLKSYFLELLRKSAEQTLAILVQALFERLTLIMQEKDHKDRVKQLEHVSKEARRLKRNSMRNLGELNLSSSSSSLDELIIESKTKNDIEMPSKIADASITTTTSPLLSPVISVDVDVIPLQVSVMNGDEATTINVGAVDDSFKQTESELKIDEENQNNEKTPLLGDEKVLPPKIDAQKQTPTPTSAVASHDPFGLPAILELIRVLVSLIDPRNRQHTDTMHRRVSLELMGIAIEVGGNSLSRWIAWGGSVQRKKRKVSSKSKDSIAIPSTSLNKVSESSGVHVEIPGGDVNGSRRVSLSMQPPVENKKNMVDMENLDHIGLGNGGLVDSLGNSEVADPQAAKSAAEVLPPYSPNVTANSPQEKEQVVLPPATTDDNGRESDDERMALAVKELVTNELCKYLFQILDFSNFTMNSPPSAATLTLLQLTLKLITSLLLTGGANLRLQYEWFLDWVMARVDSGVVGWDVEEGYVSQTGHNSENSPHTIISQKGHVVMVGEVRELLLECVSQIAQIPGFLVDLYVHFDGELNVQSHLFENLIRFLSKHTFPDATPGGPVTTPSHQLLCLDSLLAFLKHMVDRRSFVSGKDENSSEMTAIAQKLYENKKRKRILIEGAVKFNQNTKDGIKFLQTNGFLPTPADPESLAYVLKYTPKISKVVLGDYISKRDNIAILKAFIKDFDFNGKRIDEALRLLLESFRLPGESPLIERIMEVFAETYHLAMKDEESFEIKNQDATFILAYSVIMLNTDQHNPQVRKRMTLEEFKRNTRGVNDGQDFDPEYMKSVYTEIKNNEIVMPEEHEGDLGFNYTWRELLKKSLQTSPMLTTRTNVFDKDMFKNVWWPVLAAISYSLDNAEDVLTLQKAMVGFHSLAMVASHYNMVDIFDGVIVSLSKISGLLKESDPPIERSANQRVDGDGNAAKAVKRFDNWVIEFGNNYKGQVAAVMMFRLVNEHGNVLHDSWTNVIDCLRNLFIHSLLPASLMEVEDFVHSTIKIQRLKSPVIDIARQKDNASMQNGNNGIFSTLSQFLSLSSGGYQDEIEEFEPSDSDIQAEGVAFECVRSCRIDDIFLESRFLQENVLKTVISSLIKGSFSENGNGVSHTPSYQAPPRPKPKSASETPSLNTFSSSAIFFFEVIVTISLKNRDRVNVIWPQISEYINRVINTITPLNIQLLERIVGGLFRLMIRLAHNLEIVDSIFAFLEVIKALPQEKFNGIALQMMAGVSQVLKVDWSIFAKNQKRWELILELSSKTSAHQYASKFAFQTASFMLSEQRPEESVLLNPENFGDCVDLLISFASGAAGIVVSYNSVVASAFGDDDEKPVSTMTGAEAQEFVERSIIALDMLFKLNVKIPSLIEKTGIRSERAWFEFWLPILSGLGQQCYHPSKDVRHHALILLQRAMLLPALEATTLDCSVDCFDNVLFPLLDELLKPEVCRLDLKGMDGTRMRACGLLCKIFLHYFHRLEKTRELNRLWDRILGYIMRYMRHEKLKEGIQESLKNMLLVMSTQTAFQTRIPPAQAGGVSTTLWETTWTFLNPLVPNLRTELFPTELQTPPVQEVIVEGGTVIVQDQ